MPKNKTFILKQTFNATEKSVPKQSKSVLYYNLFELKIQTLFLLNPLNNILLNEKYINNIFHYYYNVFVKKRLLKKYKFLLFNCKQTYGCLFWNLLLNSKFLTFMLFNDNVCLNLNKHYYRYILNLPCSKDKNLTPFYRIKYLKLIYLTIDNNFCTLIKIKNKTLLHNAFLLKIKLKLNYSNYLHILYFANRLKYFVLENINNIKNINVFYYLKKTADYYPTEYNLLSQRFSSNSKEHKKNLVYYAFKKLNYTLRKLNSEEFYYDIDDGYFIIQLKSYKRITNKPTFIVPKFSFMPLKKKSNTINNITEMFDFEII